MRGYNDPLDFLDHRRECAHGNYKNCPECEAEGERIAAAEEWQQRIVRVTWFCYGAGAVLAPLIVGMMIWLRP